MYDMMAQPPTPGTPVESIMILVWQMRQDAQYFLTRSIVQASTEMDDGGESVQKAWREFTDKYYPYLEAQRKGDDKIALECLFKEIKKGGLTVTPLEPLTKKARQRRRRGVRSDNYIMSRLWKRKNS